MTDLWSCTLPLHSIPTFPWRCFPPAVMSSERRDVAALYFKTTAAKIVWRRRIFSTIVSFLFYFSHSFFLASLPPPPLFRSVILYGVVYSPQPNPPAPPHQPPAVSLKKNNEDLQNAKKHVAVPLIAAEGYQSLKQMAYRLCGFVLDMPTTRHRGDLWKIMRAEDYAVRLIYFTNHFSLGKIQIKLRSFDHSDNDCFCNYHCSVGFLFFFFSFFLIIYFLGSSWKLRWNVK